MPSISQKKKDKIAEQILSYLYSVSPELKFTSEIAEDTARDEEFVKSLLHDLQKKSLVVSVKKSPQGVQYSRRTRWRLSDKVYQAYKQRQY